MPRGCTAQLKGLEKKLMASFDKADAAKGNEAAEKAVKTAYDNYHQHCRYLSHDVLECKFKNGKALREYLGQWGKADRMMKKYPDRYHDGLPTHFNNFLTKAKQCVEDHKLANLFEDLSEEDASLLTVRNSLEAAEGTQYESEVNQAWGAAMNTDEFKELKRMMEWRKIFTYDSIQKSPQIKNLYFI